MNKRFLFFLLTLTAILLLSGCDLGKPTIPLTEQESDAIAQYSAHLLMKHGAAGLYGERLMDKKEYEDAIEEREAILHPTPTPEPTPTPDPNAGSEDVPGGQGGSGKEDTSNIPGTKVTASELFNPSLFDITVRDYVISDSFLGTLESFVLTAKEDEEIVAVNLDVKNITAETQHFDYHDYGVKMALAANNTSSYEPELSLLANDFQFTPSDIEAGETFTGTVIFFIPYGSEDLIFRIIGNSTAYELNLNNTSEVENGN
ncbi:MAG: DUF4352 domain-containing protein [Lachnospiraceae bacterium]|nr:DUF4352 domain-containing protein [Lachnospiraceae bacterium]